MRKHILLHILIIAFVFILTSVILSAEEDKKRLLVIPLKAKAGIDQEAVSILSDILYTEIIKLKMLTVLNRDDMKAVLDKNEFELAMGCNDNVCLLENVAKLSVSKVIVGSVGVLGKRYIVVLKLINKEGQIEVMEKDICDCPIEELTKSIEILSHKFLKYLREQVEVKKDGFVDLNKAVNVNSDKELAQTVIFEKLDGAMIVNIKDPSPAKDAGFEKGDIVIAYGNKKITNYNELLNAVDQTEVGKKVDVDVLRKGKRETQAVVISKHKEVETKEWLGLEFINLDQYVGEWKDGMMNGQGTFTWTDGDKYIGEWKDNKKHGQGTYISLDGTKYIGEWIDNVRNGQGTITWSNGTKYVGEWKNDMRNGLGTHTSPDGTKYVGEWKDSMRNGLGTITWIKGDKYEGEWKDNMMNGKGTMTWFHGEKYEGEWKDNMAVGGWYYWPNKNRKRKWAYHDSQGKFHFESKKKSWWKKH